MTAYQLIMILCHKLILFGIIFFLLGSLYKWRGSCVSWNQISWGNWKFVITILSQSKLLFVNRAVNKDQGSGFFPGYYEHGLGFFHRKQKAITNRRTSKLLNSLHTVNSRQLCTCTGILFPQVWASLPLIISPPLNLICCDVLKLSLKTEIARCILISTAIACFKVPFLFQS